MPAKGKTRVTERQRARIAAGRVAGKPAREIAEETGLSKSTVDHQALDPRTATLTLRLKRRDEAKLDEAWSLSIASILKHLKSGKAELVIGARRDLFRLLPLGDPPLLRIAPADNSGGDCTLEELLQTYRAASMRAEQGNLEAGANG